MRNKILQLLSLILLLSLFSTLAYAVQQSTINTTIPVQGSPVTSAPVRNNFAAAANDINNLYSLIPTITYPISVSNGGTGVNSLLANSLVIGNGSSAVTFLSPVGQSGNCVVSNGTSWVASSACGGGGGGSGTVTTVSCGVGSSGLGCSVFNPTTTPILTITGTLNYTNGGTGLTNLGANGTCLGSNGSSISWVSCSGGGGGASPGGSAGAVQSNNGSGGFAGLNTANSAFLFLSNNGTTPNWSAPAGLVDPRTYGAACVGPGYTGGIGNGTLATAGSGYTNGTYTAVPLIGGAGTGGQATITVAGGAVSSVVISIQGSGYKLRDVLSANTASIGGTGSGFTWQVGTLAGNATPVWDGVHDDTAAFQTAFLAAQNSGQAVFVPNGCWVSQTATPLQIPQGVSMFGQGWATTYGYDYSGGTADAMPVLYIIGHPTFGIQFGVNPNNALVGFEINAEADGNAFNSTYCVGTNVNSGGGAPKLWMYNMATKRCFAGLGAPGGNTFFAISQNSDYSTNQYGIYGNLSDFYSNGDTVDNDSTGIYLFGGSGEVRISNLRAEYNSIGMRIGNYGNVKINNSEFDNNCATGLLLDSTSAQFSITGGSFQNNGGKGFGCGGWSLGHEANITLSRSTTAPLGLFISNVIFGGYGGAVPAYDIESTTAFNQNDVISVTNSDLRPGVANVLGAFNWSAGQPPTLTVTHNQGIADQGTIANGAISSQARGLPSNNWTALNVIGDAAGSLNGQILPLEQGWGYKVAGLMGTAPTYDAINSFGVYSCDVVEQEIVPNINPNLQGNALSAFLPSSNEPSFGAGFYTGHLTDTGTCLTGGITWAAIPIDYKVFGQASAVTTTGTWANNTHYTVPAGITSQTNGSTAAFPITTNGEPIYIWFLMNTNNGGTFSYNVDGSSVLAGTATTQGQNSFTFRGGGGCGTACFTLGGIRIPGVSAGAHTVNITVTSSTSSSNTVTIEGIGSPPGKAYASTSPVLVLGGQIPDPNWVPETAAFNSLYFTLSNQLTSDGLQVPFADVEKYWVQATDVINFSGAGSGNHISAVGQTHLADAFNGPIQSIKQSMSAINPLDFGASCNTTYFATGFNGPTMFPIHTTNGSNVISISGYTFQPGVATQSGGGDVGKKFCVSTFPDAGPCTYIASVDITTNTATVGETMSATQAGSGMITGYPSNPNDPSTAHDDTLAIQAASYAAQKGGGKVFLPNHCAVHGLAMAQNTALEGNAAGNYYVVQGLGYNNANGNQWGPTVLYCTLTGYSNDSPVCIDRSNIPKTPAGTVISDVALRNFYMQGMADPAFTPTFNWTAVGIGYAEGNSDGNNLDNQNTVVDHVSFMFLPVDIGEALSYNQQVVATGSVSGTTMTISAITSTNNLNTYGLGMIDYLAVGRPVSGPGITAGSTIVSVPVGGTVGTYTLDHSSSSTGSITITSAANTGDMTGVFRDNQFLTMLFGMNGAWTDMKESGGVFSGTDAQYGWYMGPNLNGHQNGSINLIGGRFEQLKSSAIVCDGCGFTSTGVEYQFNGGNNVEMKGSSRAEITGGYMYGGGNCTGRDFTMIRLEGNGSNVSVDGIGAETANFGPCGGNTQFLFSTAVGATPAYVSVTGGAMTGPSNFVNLYDFANGNPTFYTQKTNGWPYIDTSQSNFSVGFGGNVGIGTSAANTHAALDLGKTTSAVILPSGTTAQEPSPAVAGMFRFNTDKVSPEYFNGIVWGGLSPTPNSIGGLTLSNDATTPNTVFDISRGSAASDDLTVSLGFTAAITTKTTGAFTAGSGNGCLDTGTVANSTWYHVYLIGGIGSGTADIICSTSLYPLLPTGYTEKRLIGDIKTDSSAHILAFTQLGHRITWAVPTPDMSSVTIGTSATLQALNVPPGESVTPIGNYSISNSGAGILWTDPSTTDIAPTATNPFSAAPGFSMLDSGVSKGTVNTNLPNIFTNASQQLRIRATAPATSVSENTFGWDNPFIAASSCNYTPPLDLVSGAYQAYGFRLLATNRLGLPIVRIRRTSDSMEKDFAVYLPNCTIQQNDPFFSVGGDTFFVSKWYDQSGHGLDLPIATTAAQPQVTLNCQNSQPCVTYTSLTAMTLAPAGANVGPVTYSAVVKTPASGSGNVASWGAGNPANQNSLTVGTPNCTAHTDVCSGGCTTNTNKACSASTWYAVTANFSIVNNTMDMCVNGSCQSTASTSFVNGGLVGFASGLATSRTAFTGKVAENIIFSPDISSTLYQTVTTNQRAFWGF
jgi:hypothetical protein